MNKSFTNYQGEEIRPNNYRLEKIVPENDLHTLFDADNGIYGKGASLQYRLLRHLAIAGNRLSTYMLGSDLYCNARCADGTIDKIIITPEGNHFVSKVPTMSLYKVPTNQFHTPNNTKHEKDKNSIICFCGIYYLLRDTGTSAKIVAWTKVRNR